MRLPTCLAIVVILTAGAHARAFDIAVTDVSAKPAYTATIDAVKPNAGDKVIITCQWKTTRAVGETYPTNLGSAKGRFLVDGKPIENTSVSEFNFKLSTESTAWIAVAGTHRIRCEADHENVVPETNETNNRKESVINVGGVQRVAGAGPQVATAGVVSSGGKSKACKATIYTTVQIDQAQFSAQEGAPHANPAKMTLDLVASHGLGDNVHCEYQSVGRDVKMVYTFQCANAHPAGGKHIYACE